MSTKTKPKPAARVLRKTWLDELEAARVRLKNLRVRLAEEENGPNYLNVVDAEALVEQCQKRIRSRPSSAPVSEGGGQMIVCKYCTATYEKGLCPNCLGVTTEPRKPKPAESESDSSAARGWAAQREADYRRALQRYYDTGTCEDHDECLRLFGLWLITSRGLQRPIDQDQAPHGSGA